MTKRTSLQLFSSLLVLGLTICACIAGDEPQAALRKQVPKFTSGGTLDEAMAKLSELSGLKITVDWPTLRATGVDPKAVVMFSSSNATVEQLLEMSLARAAAKDSPLAWYPQGNTIRVTTQAKVLYRHDLPAVNGGSGRSAKAKAPAAGKDLNFDNTPMSDVLNYVRDLAGVNFTVNWKSLEESGVTKETQITVQAKDISFARLLDLVLEQVNAGKDRMGRVYWVVDDGVVTIATGSALNNDMITKVVDVSDLLVLVPNFKGPVLNLSNSQGNGAGNSASGGGGGGLFPQQGNPGQNEPTDTDDPSANRQKLRESLMTAVKDSIGEDMWKPDGKGSITIVGSKMVISQTLLGFKLMEISGRKH
jgi:hypothetical protein